MDEDVLFELDSVKAKRLGEMSHHKEQMEAVGQEVRHLEESLRKAKSAHAKCVSDVRRYQERVKEASEAVEAARRLSEERGGEKEGKQLMGRFLSAFETTPEQDRDKCLKKLAKYEADMRTKSREIDTRKKRLLEAIAKRDDVCAEVRGGALSVTVGGGCRYVKWYVSICKQALLAFETEEKLRLQVTERALRRFCVLEREALERRLKLLAALEVGDQGRGGEGRND